MAYLNLMYRRKADTADYQGERDELLHRADDLVDKVKEIKMKRAEQPSRALAQSRRRAFMAPFSALPWRGTNDRFCVAPAL